MKRLRMAYALTGLLAISGLACAQAKDQSPPAQTPAAVPRELSQQALSDLLSPLGIGVLAKPFTPPALQFKDLSGNDVTLESLRGSWVLLNFWATWCPPCRAEMPSIEALHQSLSGKDFRILAVSVGEKPETVRDFLRQNPYTFPIALDSKGSISANYVSRGIPSTYLVDRSGRIVAMMVGSRDWNEVAVKAALEKLFAY